MGICAPVVIQNPFAGLTLVDKRIRSLAVYSRSGEDVYVVAIAGQVSLILLLWGSCIIGTRTTRRLHHLPLSLRLVHLSSHSRRPGARAHTHNTEQRTVQYGTVQYRTIQYNYTLTPLITPSTIHPVPDSPPSPFTPLPATGPASSHQDTRHHDLPIHDHPRVPCSSLVSGSSYRCRFPIPCRETEYPN